MYVYAIGSKNIIKVTVLEIKLYFIFYIEKKNNLVPVC